MTEQASREARRRFIKIATASVAAAPFCGALSLRMARAQERLEEDDELAQQLGYKHDASEVDASEWPSYAEGDICSGCQLYEGAEGDEWGPCQIFGGKLVKAQGWCQAYVAREA